MSVRREQAAENRSRVLRTAARFFRERGFAGIGVADLMNEAGLTHGGFYWHFRSKDDLKARAVEFAASQTFERWGETIDGHGEDALGAWLTSYLSAAHRDASGTGCPVAALAGETAREGPQVRDAMTQAAESLFTALLRLVPGDSTAEKRRKAAVTLASMVGAVVLSRAASDREFSNEILDAVRSTFATTNRKTEG